MPTWEAVANIIGYWILGCFLGIVLTLMVLTGFSCPGQNSFCHGKNPTLPTAILQLV